MQKKESPVLPIVGCMLVQLCVGIVYLWSVFSTPIATSFSWSADSAKLVSAVMMIGFVVGGFLGGILNDKKGARFTATIGVFLFSIGICLTALLTNSTIWLIYITYGTIAGIGSGFGYSAAVSCVQKWLPHKKGLATGLAASAFGFSTVIFAPFSNYLMGIHTDATTNLVNFTPVFLTLAAIFFVCGLASTVLIRQPSAEYTARVVKEKPAAAIVRSFTPKEAIKTLPFWGLVLIVFFVCGVWNLIMPLIKGLGETKGLTAEEAVFALSLTGIANAAGRLIFATVSDKIGRNITMISLAIITFAAAILMTIVGGYAYIVVVVIIALAYGGVAPVSAAMTTDVFGPKYSGTNFGIVLLGLGASSIVFNLLSSLVLKNAVGPTFIMGACSAIAAIVMCVVCRKSAKGLIRE